LITDVAARHWACLRDISRQCARRFGRLSSFQSNRFALLSKSCAESLLTFSLRTEIPSARPAVPVDLGRDAVGLTGVIYLTQVSAARM
jgi:hypothetical protein